MVVSQRWGISGTRTCWPPLMHGSQFSYLGVDEDGTITQGGYSTQIVVNETSLWASVGSRCVRRLFSRSTRPMNPAELSAISITPGPTWQLPLSARTRSSKVQIISGERGPGGPAGQIDTG